MSVLSHDANQKQSYKNYFFSKTKKTNILNLIYFKYVYFQQLKWSFIHFDKFGYEFYFLKDAKNLTANWLKA